MKQPADPNAEYVLVYDHLAKADMSKGLFGYKDEEKENVLAPRGAVVTVASVRQGGWLHESMTGGSSILEFTVKATGEKFRTTYGYMFALNTPENLQRLAAFHEVRDAYFRAKDALDKAGKLVDTIAGPFEGVHAPAKVESLVDLGKDEAWPLGNGLPPHDGRK
jgi:hypothetical protein